MGTPRKSHQASRGREEFSRSLLAKGRPWTAPEKVSVRQAASGQARSPAEGGKMLVKLAGKDPPATAGSFGSLRPATRSVAVQRSSPNEAPLSAPLRRCARRPAGRRPASTRRWAQVMRVIKSIERLVPVSCTCRHASTSGLSTSWSTTALEGELVSRWVSRLDAFSGYPVRT